MPFALVVFLTPSPCDGWPVVMLFTVGASRCFGDGFFGLRMGGKGGKDFLGRKNIRSFSVFFFFWGGGGGRSFREIFEDDWWRLWRIWKVGEVGESFLQGLAAAWTAMPARPLPCTQGVLGRVWVVLGTGG